MTCIPGLPDFRFALSGNRRYTPAPQSPVPTKNGPIRGTMIETSEEVT